MSSFFRTRKNLYLYLFIFMKEEVRWLRVDTTTERGLNKTKKRKELWFTLRCRASVGQHPYLVLAPVEPHHEIVNHQVVLTSPVTQTQTLQARTKLSNLKNKKFNKKYFNIKKKVKLNFIPRWRIG